MPRITDTELSKQLRQNDPAPLYFLYGKETYLLERAAAAIIKKAVGSEPSAFNFQKFDSQKTPVEDIQNAADALPFMAQRKCVVVENLNVEAMSAAQHEKLTELVKGVYDSCVLIFYISAIEINIKKQAKWRAFAALCEKHGVVCEFEPKDKAALSRSLCERAKKRGCVLAPANAAYIIDISSRSLLTLNHEVDKLCDFADGGKITREMINLSVSPTVEASSFDLAKAVVEKLRQGVFDIKRAFLSKNKAGIYFGRAHRSVYRSLPRQGSA